MKKLIVGIIIVLIIGVAVLVFLKTSNSFEISQDYIRKIESHYSYVDGPDIDYYIYDNKIVKETNSYYPVGSKYNHTREIVVYEGIENAKDIGTLSQVQNVLNGKSGKIVLDEKE